MKRKMKAVGMVVGAYVVLGSLVYGIRSLPSGFLEEYGTDIMLGAFSLVCTYISYKAALDLVDYREEEKKRKESNRVNGESGVTTTNIYPSLESNVKPKKGKK